MRKILITVPVDEDVKNFFYGRLEGSSGDFELVFKEAEALTPEDVKDAEAVVGTVSPEIIRCAEKLKWYQMSWAGVEMYLAPGTVREDAVFTNASGAYGLAVSEHMVAMTFALMKDLKHYAGNQMKHIWRFGGKIKAVEGSVILVLGMGDIGSRYAKKMKALGAYIIGVRRREREKPDYVDEQYTVKELGSVIGRADVVAMSLPDSDSTKHIIDREMLGRMKEGSYIINDGRGSAIDFDALKEFLDSGRIAGAGMDVTDPEPLPADDTLWDYDNVIITPHYAGQFLLHDTYTALTDLLGDNLYRYVHGQELKHIVDRKAGY